MGKSPVNKSSVKIDWIVAENEEVWQTIQSATPIEVAPNARRRQRLTLAIAITALLILTGWLWQQAVPAKAPPTVLSSTVVHESGVREEQTLTETIALLDTSVEVESIKSNGNRVMVRVIANHPEDGKMRAYRESHFYEKRDSAWQRIPPDPTLLGAIRTVQLPHFTIVYPEADADAVYETASKLEQLYAKLRGDFGVPTGEATEKATVEASSGYTIEVAARGELGLYKIDAPKGAIRIASPSTLSAPAEITAAGLLYQSIVYPLAHLTLLESITIQLGQEERYIAVSPVQSALILWEFWDEGGPLTEGRDDIMRWVYRNSQSEASTKPVGYDSICRVYHIWQAMPWETLMPLTCTQRSALVPLPWPLPTLATTWPQPPSQRADDATTEPPFYETLTMVSIIDYVVVTYGREKLPEMSAALIEKRDKEELIPMLFGCSVADFEASWQAYLAQHF